MAHYFQIGSASQLVIKIFYLIKYLVSDYFSMTWILIYPHGVLDRAPLSNISRSAPVYDIITISSSNTHLLSHVSASAIISTIIIVHHRPGLNSKPFRTIYSMLRRHIILLIAIHLLDGDVKPGSPLGSFREEQAMSRHQVSPSPFLSSSLFHTPQLHYTNSHPNFNFLQYTIQILVPHVM